MRLAVHTGTAAEELRSGRLPIAQFIQIAATLGCRGIEVDPQTARDPQAIRAAAAQAGCTIVFGSDARFPSSLDDAGPATAALATASALGAPRMSIRLPRGDPQWAFLERAGAAGVTLCLVNEAVPGSVVRVRALVDAADSPWLQALLNTAAPVLAGEDPVRSVYVLNRRLAHIHMTDVKTLLGRPRMTYPGDGELWWYGLLWALGALGYRRDMTIAFPGEGRGVELLPLAVDHLTRVYTARFPGPVPWDAAAR